MTCTRKVHKEHPIGFCLPTGRYTGDHGNSRVTSWQAAKMTARLQAATASSKPILLRVDYEAGHGIGNTKEQQEKENADEWSFLLWQFGLPEFQIPRTQ
jgi:prolyl oligopeptidase